MSLLKKHQKSKIRFQKGDLILFEPTQEQREEIEEIIKNNSTMDKELNVEMEMEVSLFRGVLKKITNIGDEVDDYSDTELIELINGGDRVLTLFVREVNGLLTEMVEDIQYEQFQMLNTVMAMVKSIEGAEKTNKTTEVLNKTLKKQGLATLEEINAVKDNPEELEKLLKQKGKGKKKTSPKKK
ncbi:MAG: hypothetical protein ACRCX8_18995 [Sarcina sp.]